MMARSGHWHEPCEKPDFRCKERTTDISEVLNGSG